MIKVSYPDPSFRIKKESGKEYIFDAIRKRWILLTPEEWVRQNFITYLITEKKYPATLIGVEKEIQLGELRKRFDILVYDITHQPWLMVECKAMDIKLDETVLQQLLRYNISLPVRYLVITNGQSCFAWHRNESTMEIINNLPVFGE